MVTELKAFDKAKQLLKVANGLMLQMFDAHPSTNINLTSYICFCNVYVARWI